MDKFTSLNLKHWNEVAKIHENAPKGYYDIENLKKGTLSLKSIELTELGDISNKKILHLLCHIGLDTLSLAKLGAQVTGVDFSSESISIANNFNKELNLNAKFICSDIYDLNSKLNEKFDIVFASYGVFVWLKDLDKFMKIVASYLNEGGICYFVDGHPLSMIMEKENGDMVINRSYFDKTLSFNNKDLSHDYADKDAIIENHSHEFFYNIGDIINSICTAGLNIEYLHEFPYCDLNYHEDMIKGNDGWWRLTSGDTIPLTFSLMARKFI